VSRSYFVARRRKLTQLELRILEFGNDFYVRRGTIRVLGLLGALDPYKHKMNLGQIDVEGNATALVSMTDPKSEIEAVQGTPASRP